MANPQDKNVGNPGDTLKHGALAVALSCLRRAAPFLYVESNAYRPVAPLQHQTYSRDVSSMPRLPGILEYIQAERPHVTEGNYLCSAALARALAPGAEMVLCEKDADARRELEEYFADKPPAPVLLEDNGMLGGALDGYRGSTGTFALFDPMKFGDIADSFEAWLERLTETTTGPCAALVFHSSAAWPSGWRDKEHPETALPWRAKTRCLWAPYRLRLYANDEAWMALQAGLRGMSWDQIA